MELVYLWVKEYKNIKKQGFNFSPRFKCKYDKDKNELTIDEKKDYVSIFPDNINVTAIVGENGSGKSNLLNLLKENNLSNIICIVLDEKKLFIHNLLLSKKKIIIKNLSLVEDSLISSSKQVLNRFQYLYFKTYLDFNNIEKNEYGFDGRNKIFGQVKRLDYLQKIFKSNQELANRIAIRERAKLKSRDIEIKMILENIKFDFHRKFSKYYLEMSSFLKDYFNDYTFAINFRPIEEIYEYSPYKDMLISDNFCNKLFIEYSKKIYVEEKLFFQESTQQDYQELIVYLALLSLYIRNQDMQDYINKINISSFKKLFLDIVVQDFSSDLIKKEIQIWKRFYELFSEKDIKKLNIHIFFEINLKLYNLIKHDILNINFSPTLSTGQERLFYILFELMEFFNIKYNRKDTIIAIDEGESFLHPALQKQFLQIIIEFIKSFFPKIKIGLLLTTHSPFLLSDLPKENVIFLKKGKQVDVDIETFGANIHTLLSHGFFMKDGLIGEFAKTKIQEVMDFLNNKKTIEGLSIEEKQIKPIIESIGEPFLKNKLSNMYFDKYSTEKSNRIKNLKAELKRLEND